VKGGHGQAAAAPGLSSAQKSPVDTRTEPAAPSDLVRYIFAGGLAGVVAGVLFLGAGSRLVMRISALLNRDDRGILTENGNRIGELTVGGTLGLLLFVGLVGGLVAGTLWVIVREWLPNRDPERVVAAGVVAALLGSFLVVSSANGDFGLLEPRALHVAMFIALVGLTGSGAALLDRPAASVLRAGRKSTLIMALLLVVGGVFGVALVTQAFLSEEFCACPGPPRLALPFIGLTALATLLLWAGWLTGRADVVPAPWLRSLATAALLGACAIAGIDLIGEIREIV